MAPAPQRILLHDIYSIALAAARIAHRAAYLQASAATTGTTSSSSSSPPAAGPSRPWPTQRIRRRSKMDTSISMAAYQEMPSKRPEPTPENLSLPSQAPDATFAEVKQANASESRDQPQSTAEGRQETMRQIEDQLRDYFRPRTSQEEPRPPDKAVQSLPGEESETLGILDSAAAPLPPQEDVTSAPQPALTPTPIEPDPLSQVEYKSQDKALGDEVIADYDVTTERRATPMRASKVPSSRIARLMHYGSLGAGLAWGAAGSFLTPASNVGDGTTQQNKGSPFMSEGNIKRLVDKLSRMRGAALKLGQFLSIQDSNLLPPEIESVLLQVQNSANYMPDWQMEKVMAEELGSEWRSHFTTFNSTPFAAASIGQVHHGVLSASHPTNPNLPVAVKIQFPGIRESIESDLGYLKWLLAASALLPKGLFLESTITQMRIELQDECDYEREAEMGRRFADIFNEGKPNGRFEVPKVIPDLCGKRVLTTEMMKGRPLSHVEGYNEARRNQIATALLELALSELFTHRLMQTDPNFSNFLYAPQTRKIQLIDFGATRDYSKAFIDDWLRLLICAVNEDVSGCKEWSTKVGYLIGTESNEMVNAHVRSMILLGSPFRRQDAFNFTHQTLTEDIKSEIPLMLAQRKTPPPKETYSLNRKLSGTFLMCSKLKATVDCQKVLRDVVDGYRFEDGGMVRFRDGRLAVEMAGGVARSGSHSLSSHSRSLHTSSKVLKDIQSARQSPIGQQEHSPTRTPVSKPVSDLRRKKRERERYGINLGDRWPRSFQASSPSSSLDKPDAYDTLAPGPAGTSMVATPNQGDHTSSADQVPLRTSPTSTEGARGAESLASAIESNTAERRREEKLSQINEPPMYVRGILVPRPPDAPGPEDCCMSGCARCVYDLYKEDLEEYQEQMGEVKKTLLDLKPALSEEEWNVELLGKRPGRGEDVGDERWKEAEPVEIQGLDPTMKAFLEMERAMKQKNKAKQ